MTINLDHLERVARALRDSNELMTRAEDWRERRERFREAANPQTVLALIARLREAEKRAPVEVTDAMVMAAHDAYFHIPPEHRNGNNRIEADLEDIRAAIKAALLYAADGEAKEHAAELNGAAMVVEQWARKWEEVET